MSIERSIQELGRQYDHDGLRGTGNKEIREMIEDPKSFYIPPSEKEWREIERNRDKAAKLKKYFENLIDEQITIGGLGAHEQIMERQAAIDFGILSAEEVQEERKGKKMKKNKMDLIREALINGDSNADIEKKLDLKKGTINKIADYIRSQPHIVRNLRHQVDLKRQQILNQAIDKLRSEEKEITDEVSGGLNRTGLEQHYQKDRERLKEGKDSEAIIVMHFDIDEFRNFNNIYGHAAGDRAILAIVNALRGNNINVQGLRASDGVGRTGGDEFVIIALIDPGFINKETGKNGEQIFVEKVASILSSVKGPDGSPITCTGGYTLVDKNSKLKYEEVNSEADNAAIFQKIKGKGEFVKYSTNLKPDISTPDARRLWAKKWVDRQFKRRESELDVEFMRAGDDPKKKSAIEKRRKSLNKQKAEAVVEKIIELESQYGKDEGQQ